MSCIHTEPKASISHRIRNAMFNDKLLKLVLWCGCWGPIIMPRGVELDKELTIIESLIQVTITRGLEEEGGYLKSIESVPLVLAKAFFFLERLQYEIGEMSQVH